MTVKDMRKMMAWYSNGQSVDPMKVFMAKCIIYCIKRMECFGMTDVEDELVKMSGVIDPDFLEPLERMYIFKTGADYERDNDTKAKDIHTVHKIKTGAVQEAGNIAKDAKASGSPAKAETRRILGGKK